jgi:hypothetical protein
MTGSPPIGRPWTLTDDDMLRKLLASGVTPSPASPGIFPEFFGKDAPPELFQVGTFANSLVSSTPTGGPEQPERDGDETNGRASSVHRVDINMFSARERCRACRGRAQRCSGANADRCDQYQARCEAWPQSKCFPCGSELAESGCVSDDAACGLQH